jgi:Mg2+ and Co2+ transporter CorA
LVINQTSGINKLTELAFFFIPLSFVTSIFSIQVLEITESPPALRTWGVAILSVSIVTYTIRTMVRSPSVRVLAMQCRLTIMNRFNYLTAS